MAVANILVFYDTATITYIISFIVQAPFCSFIEASVTMKTSFKWLTPGS
jgi:hypothetical protein